MGAMDEIFGYFPDRPDKPDFWRLSEITLMLDARCDESADFEGVVNEVIDVDCLQYMAMQRALRGLKIRTQEEINLRQDEILTASSLYMDGFMAGAHFSGESNA